MDLRGASPSIAIISNYQAGDRPVLLRDRRTTGAWTWLSSATILQTKFFGEGDPIGKTIEVEGTPFTIVGVSKAKGSVLGQSQDNFVVIPVQTYFKKWGARQGMMYYGMAMDHEHLFQAQEEARMLLRAYRHLKPKDDDTFSMLTSDALLDFWNQLTGAISATAIGVVSVFMVVGGVVIMNIMLAVVTERTHEIGIRKSVGARNRDILNQFLVESSMLAGAGRADRRDHRLGAGSLLVRSFTPVPIFDSRHRGDRGRRGYPRRWGCSSASTRRARPRRLDPIEALRMER